jgi:hypothetical protein
MLMWRARGYALRDEFPDVLKGFFIAELDDEGTDFARAKQARARLVQPQFEHKSSRSESGAQASLFNASAGVDSAPEQPSAQPEQTKQEKETPLSRVKKALQEAGESQENFLLLLAYVGMIDTDRGAIAMGQFDLSRVPERVLEDALGDWSNVLLGLEQKRWKT